MREGMRASTMRSSRQAGTRRWRAGGDRRRRRRQRHAAGVLIGGNDTPRGFAPRRRDEAVADEIAPDLLDNRPAVCLRDLTARMARQQPAESRQSLYYSTHPAPANGRCFRITSASPTTATTGSAAARRSMPHRRQNSAWTEAQRIIARATTAPTPVIETHMRAIAAFRRGDLGDARPNGWPTARHPQDPFFHEFRGDILFAMASRQTPRHPMKRHCCITKAFSSSSIPDGRRLPQAGRRARACRRCWAARSASRIGDLHRQYAPRWATGHHGRPRPRRRSHRHRR